MIKNPIKDEHNEN